MYTNASTLSTINLSVPGTKRLIVFIRLGVKTINLLVPGTERLIVRRRGCRPRCIYVVALENVVAGGQLKSSLLMFDYPAVRG